MHLYIALTSSLNEGTVSYNWILVTSDGFPTGIVNAYQITLDPGTGAWQLEHDRLPVTAIPQFLGCVSLSTHIAEKTEHIDAFIREFPAEQGRYRSDGGAGWSCIRWVMRCLENLVEAGVVALDMKRLYRTVLDRAGQLEEGKGAVTVVEGVSIIPL